MSRCTVRRSDERIFPAGNEFFGNSGLHSTRRARGADHLHHPGLFFKQREQVTERQATKVSSCFCTTRRWYITRRKVIQQTKNTEVWLRQLFPPISIVLIFVLKCLAEFFSVFWRVSQAGPRWEHETITNQKYPGVLDLGIKPGELWGRKDKKILQ